MSYFVDRDLVLIEALEYNPNFEPNYEVLKDCLIWDDEVPDNLTPDGYEKLGVLLTARSYIHRNISFSEYEINPEFLGKMWNSALEANFQWPGFKRLKLSDKDLSYYLEQTRKAEDL